MLRVVLYLVYRNNNDSTAATTTKTVKVIRILKFLIEIQSMKKND
jgi:hypothetical protein